MSKTKEIDLDNVLITGEVYHRHMKSISAKIADMQRKFGKGLRPQDIGLEYLEVHPNGNAFIVADVWGEKYKTPLGAQEYQLK